MQNSEIKNRIVQLVAESKYSECAVCGTIKAQAIYKYRAQQYIRNHIPELLEPVCRKCVYREVYGSKGYRKKMKERSLDG